MPTSPKVYSKQTITQSNRKNPAGQLHKRGSFTAGRLQAGCHDSTKKAGQDNPAGLMEGATSVPIREGRTIDKDSPMATAPSQGRFRLAELHCPGRTAAGLKGQQQGGRIAFGAKQNRRWHRRQHGVKRMAH